MNFGVCAMCCVPLRADFNYSSGIVNELLFGDQFEIVERRQDSLRIVLTSDGYQGWIEASQAMDVGAGVFAEMNSIAPAVATDLVGCAQRADRQVLIPRGSTLRIVDEKIVLGGERLSFTGANSPALTFGITTLEALCRSYLGTPYRWGGRSPWGIDCSGLVQITFKIMGVSLPRDTSQQVTVGRAIGNFDERKPGDLAFATSLNGGFSHVGIVGQKLSEAKSVIFHSSGLVREDTLDANGFHDPRSGIRSHELREIRRVEE